MIQDTEGFREKFYLPLNFLAWSNNGEGFRYQWDQNMLKNLNSELNRKSFEEAGWKIYEIEIPDNKIKKFHNLCFEKKPKKDNIESLIEDIIYSAIESYQSEEGNSDQQK